MNMNNPSDLGYRMPAEWNKHSATQLHWPSNVETWPDIRLKRVESVYLDIIEALSQYEPIVLLHDVHVSKTYLIDRLRSRSIDLNNIIIYSIPINDVWARDCGPIFVKHLKKSDDEYAITDWKYNSWGGKYPPYDSDNAIPKWFSETFGIPCFSTNVVLEGGSIDTNGDGILMTTESVLLNPNRNPDLSKSEIEQILYDYLGIEKIIWLKQGLAGDDTDGHIDDLSRFINQNTILTMVAEDETDINFSALNENLMILEEAINQYGNSFQIFTLPLPQTKIVEQTVDGSHFVPASYANFYIANGVVLVPLYDERYDEMVLDLFCEFFPTRDIIGINCTDLVWGQGSIHCITQQLYGLNLPESLNLNIP
jgi:agmatine deiminase